LLINKDTNYFRFIQIILLAIIGIISEKPIM